MPTARLRLSNVYEVGLSANRIPQLPQSATESIVCHALHTKYIAKQGNFVVTKYPKNQGGAVPCDPDLGQPLCVWL